MACSEHDDLALNDMVSIQQEAAAQRVSVKLTADEEAGCVRLELHVPSEPAAVKAEDGDIEMKEAAEPQPMAATAGREYVPGAPSSLNSEVHRVSCGACCVNLENRAYQCLQARACYS